MLEEYLLLATAIRGPWAARAEATIRFAADAADAAAQARLWALEALPPGAGWAGHAVEVELLDRLRPILAEAEEVER